MDPLIDPFARSQCWMNAEAFDSVDRGFQRSDTVTAGGSVGLIMHIELGVLEVKIENHCQRH